MTHIGPDQIREVGRAADKGHRDMFCASTKSTVSMPSGGIDLPQNMHSVVDSGVESQYEPIGHTGFSDPAILAVWLEDVGSVRRTVVAGPGNDELDAHESLADRVLGL